jgi:hypothetical protein
MAIIHEERGGVLPDLKHIWSPLICVSRSGTHAIHMCVENSWTIIISCM